MSSNWNILYNYKQVKVAKLMVVCSEHRKSVLSPTTNKNTLLQKNRILEKLETL